jgi:hypothetical protein
VRSFRIHETLVHETLSTKLSHLPVTGFYGVFFAATIDTAGYSSQSPGGVIPLLSSAWVALSIAQASASRKLPDAVPIPRVEGVYSQLTSPSSSSFCVSTLDASGAAG